MNDGTTAGDAARIQRAAPGEHAEASLAAGLAAGTPRWLRSATDDPSASARPVPIPAAAEAWRGVPSARAAIPFHFGPEARPRFAWYHPAAGDSPRGAGVVLCNTLGNEALRAYGTLRHLAENLAAAGFAALRFDFYGTGDSGGSEACPDQVATWLADIDLAVDELRARSGLRDVGVAGLRLGGTLALLAAARRGDVESVVLWDPYYQGKEFVTETTRMHKALAMLEPASFALKRPAGSGPAGVEALGFLLADATVRDLGQLDLLAVEKRPAQRVLVVGSAAAQKRGGEALMKHLRALGADPAYEVLAEPMNRNLRLVSAEDHQRIAAEVTRWLAAHLGGTTPPSDSTTSSPRPVARRADPAPEPAEMDEEPVFFGEREALFGIATHPPGRRGGDGRPAILMLNAGPGTRIGPHRQYVRMARAWAQLGFVVLRVDLSGSGDSAGAAGASESDPYPRHAVADVRAAMALLEQRFAVDGFIVAGVCSGADIAFRAAVEEPRVVGAFVLNPRTFALHDIPNIDQLVRAHHLAATVSSKKNWRLLLRGETGLRGSLLRVAQVSRTAARSLAEKLRALLGRSEGPVPVADVPAEMRRLLDRGVDTLLVVGERDVGILYVEMFFREQMRALERIRGFRRVDIKGIDHLFTGLHAQDLLLEVLTEHLRRKYP